MFGVMTKVFAILVCIAFANYVHSTDCCVVPEGLNGVGPEECSAYMSTIGCDFYFCASCSCGPEPNRLFILGCDETYYNPCEC